MLIKKIWSRNGQHPKPNSQKNKTLKSKTKMKPTMKTKNKKKA
jgi:hypothetical protein